MGKHDGGMILINTAAGRIKEKNINQGKRVALSVYDRSNLYNMVTIKGNVNEIIEQGADSHIDKLAKKYLELNRYTFHNPDEKRIILESPRGYFIKNHLLKIQYFFN